MFYRRSFIFGRKHHVDSRGSQKLKVGFTDMPLWDQVRFNLLLSPLNVVVRAMSHCTSSHSKHHTHMCLWISHPIICSLNLTFPFSFPGKPCCATSQQMFRNIAQLLLELLDVCVCITNCAVWTSSAIYNVSQAARLLMG